MILNQSMYPRILLDHTKYVLCKGLKSFNAICSLVLRRWFLIRCAILVYINIYICIHICLAELRAKALHIGNANNCFEFLSLISNAGHKRRNFRARTSIFADCEYAQNVSFPTACIDAELRLKNVEFRAKTFKLNEGWKIGIFQQKKNIYRI